MNWKNFERKNLENLKVQSRLFENPNFPYLLWIVDQVLDLWVNWEKLCSRRLSLASLFKIRDFWQITFVPSSPPPRPSLFLMDKSKIDRIPNKIKWKIYTFFECTSYKNLQDAAIRSLFLFVFIRLYGSRYHFSKSFRTSFNSIWKKYFCHEFFFFNGFSQTFCPYHKIFGQKALKIFISSLCI